MKVTRDVVYDLLPGYFAGELSADSKAMVDEFFATDPEFARMAERFRKLFNERRGDAVSPAGHERVVFERARSFRTAADRRFGIAVGCTLGALLALFVGALVPRFLPSPTPFGFMREPLAIAAVVFGAIAVTAWGGWLLGRLTATDHRPPTTD
jgi:anti-sigma factor RsiW